MVHGATLFNFYVGEQRERKLWQRVGDLGKEIAELAPVLESYEVPVSVPTDNENIHVLGQKGRR